MDHEWVDASQDVDPRHVSVDARTPENEDVRVHVNLNFSYHPSMDPMRCVRCGMKKFNGKPESKDDCDVHVVRKVLES